MIMKGARTRMTTNSISRQHQPSTPIEVVELLCRKIREWASRRGLWAVLYRYASGQWEFILWNPKERKAVGEFSEKIRQALANHRKEMDEYVAHLNRLDDRWDAARSRMATGTPADQVLPRRLAAVTGNAKVRTNVTATEESGGEFHSNCAKSGVLAVMIAGVVATATAMAGIGMDTPGGNIEGGFLHAKI